jgi:hypothetical protein
MGIRAANGIAGEIAELTPLIIAVALFERSCIASDLEIISTT